MDENVLNIICCDNLARETKKATFQMDLKDIHVSSFRPVCHVNNIEKIDLDPSIKDLLTQKNNQNVKAIMCKLCPMGKHKFFEEIEKELVTTIFELFLDEKIVEYIVSRGGFIVTNSWLENYKKHMKICGNKCLEFNDTFKESEKKIIYLDDNEELDEKNIKKLSVYMDSEYQRIPIEMTYLKLFLIRMKEKWKNENEIQKLKKQCIQSAEYTSSYATLFNMIELLSGATSEREIIRSTIDMYKTLFNAKYIKFFPEKVMNHKYKWMKETLKNGYAFLEDKKGFAMLIESNDEIIGAFLIKQIDKDENIIRYMNFCKNTIKVIAMSLSMRNFKEIKYLSDHDGLTDLYNRMYYMRQIEELKQLKIDSIGIVVCDIDNLKYINDKYGHYVGDQLIISMAKVLKDSFREEDIIARYGGDEFSVIIKNCNNEAINNYRNRIKENTRLVNHNLKEVGMDVQLNFSIGFAFDKLKTQNIEKLFKLADQEMYSMKSKKIKLKIKIKYINI